MLSSLNLKPSDIISSKKELKKKDQQFVMKGIPSSPGIVIASAILLKPETIISPNKRISDNKIEQEIQRFDQAHSELVKQFMGSLGKVKNENSNIIAIVETNLLILTDPTLGDSIKAYITKGFSVESAVVTEFEKQRNFLKNSPDDFLRERADELDHIKQKLIAVLRNKCIFYEDAKDSIVVAQALNTTDVVNLKEQNVKAIVMEVGGITSHTSILSRSFEIPAVIGVREATEIITDGTTLIVDGFAGIVVANPKDEVLSLYLKKINEIEEHHRRLGKLVKLPAETYDGHKIELKANINFLEDIRTSEVNGADGVGLVRSENLIMELKHIPDEETQYKWYREITDRAYPKPVTIRVFDIGSDKYSEGLPFHEENPALGLRGIRFLLSRKDIFGTQIRAILRSSSNKNIRIMLPMISSLHEVEQSLLLINACKQVLESEGILFDRNIQVGVMIETPAAAMISDGLADASDFFSIGTNDLTQYTLAADRTNELVSDIFDSFHPAVLRLIDRTIRAAKLRGIPVSVCGELAGHAASTDLLLGLGVDELSVAPSIILELKDRIRNSSIQQCKKLASEILNCSCYSDVRDQLKIAISRHDFID